MHKSSVTVQNLKIEVPKTEIKPESAKSNILGGR